MLCSLADCYLDRGSIQDNAVASSHWNIALLVEVVDLRLITMRLQPQNESVKDWRGLQTIVPTKLPNNAG